MSPIPCNDRISRRMRRRSWSRRTSIAALVGCCHLVGGLQLFRDPSDHSGSSDHSMQLRDQFVNWGVDFEPPLPVPKFPHTCHEVADAASRVISATLYGGQSQDPNIASNAMRRSLLDHRPVHKGQDRGRIGIEIDGARFLLDKEVLPIPTTNIGPGRMPTSEQDAEGRGVRRVAITLAEILSRYPWEGQEQEEEDKNTTRKGQRRPVLIYFNTLQQTLMASRELMLLKEEEAIKEKGTRNYDKMTGESAYDNVTILCLGEKIPRKFFPSKKGAEKRKHRDRLDSGVVDPKKGIVIIAQPTDANFDVQPPGPAAGKVLSLQGTLAQASFAQLPAIVLSPRLTEQYGIYQQQSGSRGSFSHTGSGGGFDQSGYQESATYGGAEPPRGPTPWLMRDFTPPVFAWVGGAFDIAGRKPSPGWIQRKLLAMGKDPDHVAEVQYHSRISLMHSVADVGRPWHLFAAINHVTMSGKANAGKYNRPSSSTSYQYVASTKTSSGRPSRNILKQVFSEWC